MNRIVQLDTLDTLINVLCEKQWVSTSSYFAPTLSQHGTVGHELKTMPNAAATFYWNPLGKQVRIEGRVEMVSTTEADAYWLTRPRASQLSASASRQSSNLADRAVLAARRSKIAQKYRGKPIPRPLNWSGFRLVPNVIEFWIHRDNRLHHREVFVRTMRGWKSNLLSP